MTEDELLMSEPVPTGWPTRRLNRKVIATAIAVPAVVLLTILGFAITDRRHSDESSAPFGCVVWEYRDGRHGGNGGPISYADAVATAADVNRRYPEIVHWVERCTATTTTAPATAAPQRLDDQAPGQGRN